MLNMKLSLNDNCIIEQPNLHDAEMLAIDMQKVNSEELILTLQTVDGTKIRIFAYGVSFLRSQNFTTQNVVFQVHLLTGNLGISKFENFADTFSEYPNTFLDDLKKGLADGRTSLLNIEASVGCELTLLCSRIELVKE